MDNHGSGPDGRPASFLRIVLGIIILVTWYENFNKNIYTADGIVGLFDHIFNTNGGGPLFYRAIINNTILAAPGMFAFFQMVAELAIGVALLFGALTVLFGFSAALFFLNLVLAYWGGQEWIWTYVLLTASAVVVALSRSGRYLGIDRYLAVRFAASPMAWLR